MLSSHANRTERGIIGQATRDFKDFSVDFGIGAARRPTWAWTPAEFLVLLSISCSTQSVKVNHWSMESAWYDPASCALLPLSEGGRVEGPYGQCGRAGRTPTRHRPWTHLRLRRAHGHRFRYRRLIGGGVSSDFACRRRHPVVEVDGGEAANRTSHDAGSHPSGCSPDFREIRPMVRGSCKHP